MKALSVEDSSPEPARPQISELPTESQLAGIIHCRREEMFRREQKGRPHGPPHLNREVSSALPLYFFSSAGFSAGGGAGACAGGAGVCVAPDMPSLKLRMPSPNPFMISGMR